MYKKDLNNLIDYKKSYLCITLNYTEEEIKCFGQDMSVYDFIKKIIDTTSEYVVAYRLSGEFYQTHDMFDVFEKIISYINKKQVLLLVDFLGQKLLFEFYNQKGEPLLSENIRKMPRRMSLVLNLIREDTPDFVLKDPEDINKQNMILTILGKKDANSDFTELYRCLKDIKNIYDPKESIIDYIFIVNDMDDIQYARQIFTDDFVIMNNIITQNQLMYCIYENMTRKNWGVIIDDTDQIIVNSPDFFGSIFIKTKEIQENMESIITLLTK